MVFNQCFIVVYSILFEEDFEDHGDMVGISKWTNSAEAQMDAGFVVPKVLETAMFGKQKAIQFLVKSPES